MLRIRTALLGMLGLALAVAATTGCATSSGRCGAATNAVLPTDLPTDPEACTRYCKVWVPPVYRQVPKLCEKKPGCAVEVPETVLEARYREVCVKPRCDYPVQTPDKKCEKSLVQVTPGGYRWKKDECGCWKYCYEKPCYQWCNKVVTEKGIGYCMEVPPEYRVEVTHVPVQRCRTVYQPGQYEVKYVSELFTPGHWEWQPQKLCNSCECPAPCPEIPHQDKPCVFVTSDCPRSN